MTWPNENKSIYTFISACAILLILFTSTASADDKSDWIKNHDYALHGGNGGSDLITFAGGPDQFGYYFYDSREGNTNAPRYVWRDISISGTPVNLTEDDQVLGPFPLGFSTNFYGQIVTQYYICSNGWISFSSPEADYINRPIPTADQPNDLLAVFWDDLKPDSGLVYRYTNNADTCIVSWHNYKRFSGTGRYTFEAIIIRGYGIIYQYQSLSGLMNSHTIGIENRTGTTGLQYIYNTNRNETGSAIYFGSRPPHYTNHDVSPNALIAPGAGGQVNDSIVPVVRFINGGNTIVSFSGRVQISHESEEYNQLLAINGLRPDNTIDIVFPSFTPLTTGQYTITATSVDPNDLRHSNDTLRAVYTVYADIYQADFEADWSSFAGNNDWDWGRPTIGPDTAHSGIYLWATGLRNHYSIGPLLSTLYSDTLLLDSSATLSFWHWYDVEALFDGGNVKISSNDGLTWELLQPAGGYDGTISDVFFNPIGGEEAFFGSSGAWLQETFNLDQYGGENVIIKFDFGSDNSTAIDGWYIDDFAVIGAHKASLGWIAGAVTDIDSAQTIPGVVIHAGNRSAVTDSSGHFIFDILPGVYSLSAQAPAYSPDSSNGVTVIAGDTTVLDFSMIPLVLSLDTTAIDTSLSEHQNAIFSRLLQNTGNAAINFVVRLDYGLGHLGLRKNSPDDNSVSPEQAFDFGDEVVTFDPQTPTDDINCVGVEFDGGNFWVTGKHIADGNHKLYRFDRDGNLLAEYNQNTFSEWGWRDLAFDGQYLYASDENEFVKIDPATGQRIADLPRPITIPFPLRGLAYDPITDHFWAANFDSDIIEFDRTAATLHSYPNDRHIYGLAWDDASPDGPWLWVFSQDGASMTQISQFDPRLGHYTGVEFDAIDHNGGIADLAQGACFTSRWDSAKGIFFGMVAGRTTIFDSHDLVQGYEIVSVPQWMVAEPMSGILDPHQSVQLEITVASPDSFAAADSMLQGSVIVESEGLRDYAIPVRVGLRSGIDGNSPAIPNQFALNQNYPNPFNSATQIGFALPASGNVKLTVYNLLGQQVACLIDGNLDAGYHSVIWDASNFTSGIYYYRLSAKGFAASQRMTLLK
jgi:hypothetical protein